MTHPVLFALAPALPVETAIRLGAFAGVFGLMALWEVFAPRRHAQARRVERWPGHFALVALGAVLARVLFQTSAVAVAGLAQSKGWGLLNIWPPPDWFAMPLAIVALDFALYVQHATFHFTPALWRLHRLHHADTVFDVSTGLRFHPFELVLSAAFKMVVVLALGAPPLAVLGFEILLNATSMFNHANIRLPPRVDAVLRLLAVTPDMHRVHHSTERRETDSNFGFNLPWWDWLFGTYRAEPAAGLDAMTIGLPEFREAGEQRFDRMLMQPWRER